MHVNVQSVFYLLLGEEGGGGVFPLYCPLVYIIHNVVTVTRILEQIISAGQLRLISKESLCEVKTTATKTPKLSQNASKPLSEGRNLNIFWRGPDPIEDCRTHTYAYHHFSPQTQLLDRRHRTFEIGIWQVATYIPLVTILS